MAHSKPKHRARVYEQFMLIAQHLRKLNNYDSLYAVISGMREASVHRLGQTHALVKASDALRKDFQSHLKLMDPRGGYVTYRKALQSDVAHGRSAIPLLYVVLSFYRLTMVAQTFSDLSVACKSFGRRTGASPTTWCSGTSLHSSRTSFS